MAAALAALIPAASRAQDMGQLLQMPVEDLLSVSSVTASGGTAEERATASGNVTIIQRQEIENAGWRSVAEVLANVPGLYVIDDGSLVSVGVRGVTGGLRAGTRLVKIMINGTPVSFRPDLRAFIGPEYIPMVAVERIEVVKGPLSALYGANAFLATVNVITRTIPFGTTVEASLGAGVTGGSHLAMGASGVATYSGERARLLLGITALSLDRSGLTVQKTFAAQDPADDRWRGVLGERSRNDVSAPLGGFLQLVLPGPRLGDLTLDAGFQRLDAAAEFQLNSSLTHESRESLWNAWLAAKHDRRWSDRFTTQLTLGAATGAPTQDERLFVTNNLSRTYTRNFGYRSLSAALAATYTFGRLSLRLVADSEIEQERILYYTALFNAPQGNRMEGERLDIIPAGVERKELLSDVGLGLQLSAQPFRSLPGLQLTANGRVDRVAYGGDFEPPLQVSARGSAVYRWAPWLVTKVIAGRAFQSPSAIMMYAQPGFGQGNNLIGNLAVGSAVPPLRPQTLTGVEAIGYALLGQIAALELAGFYQHIKDKIEFVVAGTDHVARNTAPARYLGVESTLRLSFWRLSPHLSGSLLRRLADAGAPAGQRLPSYPERSATFGLDAEVLLAPRLHLTALVRYVGARGATEQNIVHNLTNPYELPAYVSSDLSLSTGRLSLLGEVPKTRFQLTVRNLLDERYSEPGFGGIDPPAARRSVFFEVHQTF